MLGRGFFNFKSGYENFGRRHHLHHHRHCHLHHLHHHCHCHHREGQPNLSYNMEYSRSEIRWDLATDMN
eukprot:1500103-Karenia_brevis.AAC.1